MFVCLNSLMGSYFING